MSPTCCAEEPATDLGAASPNPVPDSWNPRHDPRFERTWLTYLLAHFGEWCRASDIWSVDDAYQRATMRLRAHEVVQGARRLGLVIEGDRMHGYRVTGHAGLPRYLHLREHVEEREETPPADQLTLSECAAVG